jgi:hypothetical protein
MPVEQLLELRPVEPLAAPIQPLMPEPLDLASELGIERRRLIHDRFGLHQR